MTVLSDNVAEKGQSLAAYKVLAVYKASESFAESSC